MNGWTRREFVAACGAQALAMQSGTTLGADDEKKKPNLLFVLTDQQSYDMIGAVNPQVQTPVVDELARQGVRFDHCVSNHPLCTPYRGMLLSGQHPLYNGCFTNDVPLLPNSENRFAHVLNRAGYETAYIGKWHLYGGGTRNTGIPQGPNRHGFDGTFLTNNCHVDYRPESCYYWDDDNKKIFFKDVYPDRPWELEAQTRQAETWFQNRDRNKPFALFVSWHPPHDYGGDGCPAAPGRQYNYDVDVLDPALREPYQSQQIQLRPGMPIQESMRACRNEQYRDYMGMVTACDTAFGRLLDQLKQQGVYDDTLIVFTSDHGDMLGSHGAQRPKQYPQDYSARVPLIMRLPNRLPTGRTSELLIGSLDLMPTILSIMGLPIPADVDGTDLSQAMVQGRDTVSDSVPIWMFPSRGAWRGVYTNEWTYARGIAGDSERQGVQINVLYNRQDDPGQLNNLFGNSSVAAIQAKLEARTQAWLDHFGDRNYDWQDFERAQQKSGLPSWNKNYSHRPIDLLRSVRA